MFKFLKFKQSDIFTALTNKGTIRTKNEDYVTSITHPFNNKFKLLAVADGVGGNSKGEYASKFVINELEQWFTNIPLVTLYSSIKTAELLYKVIIDINNRLYLSEYNKSNCGTTLTCAIITDKETLIANIGDSRAYAIINNELKQLTKDDSLVWYYYEQGKLTKDELRYHTQSNLITKCIGHKYNVKPTILKIGNNIYSGLILFTDGITDCLSDDRIKFIINRKHKNNIANQLIKEAVFKKQHNKVPLGLNFHNIIPGKDNASVALYIKKAQ